MDELKALHALAAELGVLTSYTDDLGRTVEVAAETLAAVCAALGAEIERTGDAPEAIRSLRASRSRSFVPPVLVAWDGRMGPVSVPGGRLADAELRLEDGSVHALERRSGVLTAVGDLPHGYHRLSVSAAGRSAHSTVISAPTRSWSRPDASPAWGVGVHLSALRSRRSRSIGDLRDLEALCGWVGRMGGKLVTVLPLLPTFNTPPAEPSPYSPVSRLFWSELLLDLGDGHRVVSAPERLDVSHADREVRDAVAAWEHGSALEASSADTELLRYTRFRGAQARLGRDWRKWPEAARRGDLGHEADRPSARDLVDQAEERFHRTAQLLVRAQLEQLRDRIEGVGVRLGLDLAVGAHPDGYDPWSRPHLFAEGVSVGAPPDRGFPSGQDWGFAPVLPDSSRQEGHRYLADCIAHQASLAGLLRVDHVMALSRLYWIPHGADRTEGTYVTYPLDELFAVLTLESHRNRTEIVGEDLGTVPREIRDALPRHRIPGMYLAQFAATAKGVPDPMPEQVALIGTHDTATWAGWLRGADIEARRDHALVSQEIAETEREERVDAVARLVRALRGGGTDAEAGAGGASDADAGGASDVDAGGANDPDASAAGANDPATLLHRLLIRLGRSRSPWVLVWLEDLWLEADQVNLPGTSSGERANWQRPMARLLDEVLVDPEVDALVRSLAEARAASGKRTG